MQTHIVNLTTEAGKLASAWASSNSAKLISGSRRRIISGLAEVLPNDTVIFVAHGCASGIGTGSDALTLEADAIADMLCHVGPGVLTVIFAACDTDVFALSVQAAFGAKGCINVTVSGQSGTYGFTADATF